MCPLFLRLSLPGTRKATNHEATFGQPEGNAVSSGRSNPGSLVDLERTRYFLCQASTCSMVVAPPASAKSNDSTRGRLLAAAKKSAQIKRSSAHAEGRFCRYSKEAGEIFTRTSSEITTQYFGKSSGSTPGASNAARGISAAGFWEVGSSGGINSGKRADYDHKTQAR